MTPADSTDTAPSTELDVRPVDETLAPGAPVGAYLVDRVLGRGGFATVYRAHHKEIATVVAIKVLSRALAADAEGMKRFAREAQTASTLAHPNIVRVLTYGRLEDGRAYQVMDLVDGPTLDELLANGAPGTARALAILGEVARALAWAHARGIVHRDLKPANILLERRGDALVPRLTDFGIAKALGTDADSKLTRTGVTLGTPAYMSPEQAMGGEIGPASDIYAFGVMAFELLAGRVPFSAESPFALMMKHVQAPPPALSEVAPACGTSFDGAVARMLAKAPEDRPASIEDAMASLAAAATLPVRGARRKLSVAIPAIAVAVALAVTLALVVRSRGTHADPGAPVVPANPPPPSLPADVPARRVERAEPPPPAPMATEPVVRPRVGSGAPAAVSPQRRLPAPPSPPPHDSDAVEVPPTYRP